MVTCLGQPQMLIYYTTTVLQNHRVWVSTASCRSERSHFISGFLELPWLPQDQRLFLSSRCSSRGAMGEDKRLPCLRTIPGTANSWGLGKKEPVELWGEERMEPCDIVDDKGLQKTWAFRWFDSGICYSSLSLQLSPLSAPKSAS